MSIPLRYGTTEGIVDAYTDMILMCQFLLGTVQQKILPKNIRKGEIYYGVIMCQFLLGTVQQSYDSIQQSVF